MSKFVRVKLAPKHIREDEYVVHQPSFYQEIMACESKRPRNNLLTPNYLREIVAAIGNKYVGESFNAMTDVNVSAHRGVPCDSSLQLNILLTELFTTQYPSMLELAVEHQLKQRPSGIKLIYFTGDPSLATVFIKNGIDEVLEKDLQEKPKKGKPALSDAEINAKKDSEETESQPEDKV